MAQEIKHVTMDWEAGLRFRGGTAGGPAITIDGDNAAAPGPMTTLLAALAACTGSDLVLIMEKMRVAFTACRVAVQGTRREEEPRRYVAIHLEFIVSGDGLDEAKVRRAAALSLEKYCSVAHSIAPDIALTHDVRVGG
jgi:putative redox protein